MVSGLPDTSKFASIATGGGLKLRWFRGLDAYGFRGFRVGKGRESNGEERIKG